MRSRTDFHEMLKNTVGPDVDIYYQPPVNIRLDPPYVIYNDDLESVDYGSNIRYHVTVEYGVQLITTKADDPNVEKILNLPYTRRRHHYTVDRLHHYNFTINF